MHHLILALLLTISTLASTCTVKIVDNKYNVSIVSDVPRVPSVDAVVPIPVKVPIVKDSFYNMCIIYYNKPQDSRPVAGSHVSFIGEGWRVEEITGKAGCVTTILPSDANFTIHATNPEANNTISRLNGHITSAKRGQLLSNKGERVMPFEDGVLHISNYTIEAGVKEHKIADINHFWLISDLKVAKHSIVLHVPTIPGTEYEVKLKIDRAVWVFFSDSSRTSNPAKLTVVNKDHIITIDKFKATKTETRLYFQPKTAHKTTVEVISIKKVEAHK